MSRHRRALLSIAALLLTTACKDESERLTVLVDDYAQADSDVWLVLCLCPVEAGYMTSDDCEAGYDAISGSEQQCMVDVFAGKEGIGEDYFECVLPIMSDYEDCLRAYASCGEGWADTCLDQREAAVTACPLPSDEQTAELLACL
ncbi:hypothetical protein ACNOYE_34815 [Nannocystaceae bacterium ST9]